MAAASGGKLFSFTVPMYSGEPWPSRGDTETSYLFVHFGISPSASRYFFAIEIRGFPDEHMQKFTHSPEYLLSVEQTIDGPADRIRWLSS